MADGTDLWAALLREKWYYAHSEQHLNVKTALNSDRQTPNSSVRPLSKTFHCYSTLTGKKKKVSQTYYFLFLPSSIQLPSMMIIHSQPQGHHVHKDVCEQKFSCLACRSLGL